MVLRVALDRREPDARKHIGHDGDAAHVGLAARAQMEAYFEDWGRAMTPYWPDRQWGYVALAMKDLVPLHRGCDQLARSA
jgi:hypothetical protein